MCPFPGESRTLSTRGVGSCPRELIACSNLDVTVCFGIATIGLEFGEVECWMRPSARYWSSTASACLAKMGLMRYVQSGSDGLNVQWDRNLERDKGAGANVGFG